MSVKRGNDTVAGLYSAQSFVFCTEEEAKAGTVTNKVVSPKTCNDAVDNKVGDLEELTTTDKDNVVEAVNELDADCEKTANKGVANGYAPLNASGKVDNTYLPAISSYHPTIFDFKWADHLLNDIQWLRADTFSWQSGTTYSQAYNELVSEYNAQKVDLYAYKDTSDNIIYTNTDEPTTSDYAYGGSPIHQLGAITSVSGDDITYNSVTYTRSTTDDTEDVIHTLESSIYYVRTTKGYKIALASQESAILSKYNTDGIAWYYILDTTNKQFKLPRTKWGFKGLRGNVGDDISQSVLLPNITGNPRLTDDDSNSYVIRSNTPTGCYELTTVTGEPFNSSPTSSTSVQVATFNASRSSSVYSGDGTNTLIQERATQMYLYFYVGEYTQTATEQTAGLNAELFNGKLDLNASGLSSQGKEYISSLGMPSNRYIDLTLGASGSTYTAPANGWLCFYTIKSTAGYSFLMNTTTGFMSEARTTLNGSNCGVYIPARKNDIVMCNYDGVNNNPLFRFYYAEGDE